MTLIEKSSGMHENICSPLIAISIDAHLNEERIGKRGGEEVVEEEDDDDSDRDDPAVESTIPGFA